MAKETKAQELARLKAEYEARQPRHRREMHQDAKGGDGGSPEDIPPEPGEGASSFLPSAGGGPRIVINPTTFRNKKDALCVAFNEGFRLWMEANDFQPRSEPTDAQRKFFSDTAYADDELQLRRTILARIATFDTSVKDPTDDQLSETAKFLGAILESDWCKNEWERDSVSRLAQAAQAAVGAEPVEPRGEPLEAAEAEPLQARAAMGGGETDDDEEQAAPEMSAEETGDKLAEAMSPSDGQPGGQETAPEQGEAQGDVNGDGSAIDHPADYEDSLEAENESDLEETNVEYERLRQSGALDDNASFDNSGQLAAQKREPGEPEGDAPGAPVPAKASGSPAAAESAGRQAAESAGRKEEPASLSNPNWYAKTGSAGISNRNWYAKTGSAGISNRNWYAKTTGPSGLSNPAWYGGQNGESASPRRKKISSPKWYRGWSGLENPNWYR